MALDSAAKRFSMMSILDGIPLIPPDGTIDQGDRQTFLLKYSGLLFQTTVLGGGWSTNDIQLLIRKR